MVSVSGSFFMILLQIQYEFQFFLPVTSKQRQAKFCLFFWYLLVQPLIIERLDRKLADAIGSNTVEKCDVTLSRAIQPLTSDVLRVLFFLAYFTISYYLCLQLHTLAMFWSKGWRGLLLEKTVRGYKTGRGKRQFWVNDYETCESEEWLQRPIILCTKRET